MVQLSGLMPTRMVCTHKSAVLLRVALQVWNESPFDPDWIVRLRQALDAAGLRTTKIIAADDVYWGQKNMDYPDGLGTICDVCLGNATVRAAVGAIGSHYDWDNSRGTGAACQQLRSR